MTNKNVVQVYFDYVKTETGATICAVAYENASIVFSKAVDLKREEVEFDNQYHLSLKAMLFSLRELTNSGLYQKQVTLCNQNNLIFNWLENQTFGMDYLELYEAIYTELTNLVQSYEFSYEVIQGKDNRAKKLLKTKKKAVKHNKPSNYKLNLDFIKPAQPEQKKKVAGEVVNIKDYVKFSI